MRKQPAGIVEQSRRPSVLPPNPCKRPFEGWTIPKLENWKRGFNKTKLVRKQCLLGKPGSKASKSEEGRKASEVR